MRTLSPYGTLCRLTEMSSTGGARAEGILLNSQSELCLGTQNGRRSQEAWRATGSRF